MEKEKFPVNEFEYLCYRREHEQAGRQLVDLLGNIDQHYGVLMDIDEWAQSEQALDVMDDHLLTRLTSAVTALVTDPGFTISDFGIGRLQLHQRWISALFAASSFRNADHILRSLGVTDSAKNEIQLRTAELRKFQLFYLVDSEVRLDWDLLWEFNKVVTAFLAVSILSTRLMASPSAHQKREMLLRWLPDRLDQIESIDQLPMGVMHDMYMHCSYADHPGKHDIKKPINTLIRRKLASVGLTDTLRPAQKPAPNEKPTLVVVLEWFSKNHSIYRTHSQTMVAMRKRFRVVGMGYDSRVDETGKAVFDEFVSIEGDNVWEHARHVQRVCEQHSAQIMYMPSVGMFPITMALACLRVAPLQMMALGHPATTHGHAMDYVVVEEDYVGDEACFSEKLLKLPKDGMPYRPPAAMLELKLPERRAPSNTVKIAVAATIIKLNPGFLRTCGEIVRQSKTPVEFHFLVGQANGLSFLQVRNIVRRLVGKEAVVHKHQNYDTYMQVIAGCDMFLNPFPFGNTNGIVDTVWAGLAGVCKTGREVHEHIDEGMFRRLGFPDWTITHSTQEYMQAALRLINDPQERTRLEKEICGPHAVEKLIFNGRPDILGKRMQALWRARIGQKPPPAPPASSPRVAQREATVPAEDGVIVSWLQKEVEDYFSAPLRTEPKVILDIGANIGAFARRAHRQWPQARIVCYEPEPSNVAQLRANVESAWATVMPYAVREQSGEAQMFMGDIFVTHSFTQGTRQTGRAVTVQCVAASELPACDLLKLDTEGCEVEILRAMNLDGVKAILLEFHSSEDRKTILQQLSDDGFACLHDEPGRAFGTMVFERALSGETP